MVAGSSYAPAARTAIVTPCCSGEPNRLRQRGDRLVGHAAGQRAVLQEPQPFSEQVGLNGAQEPQDIEGVLVPDAVVGVDSFHDLVDLGDQECAGAGHPHGHGSVVARVEGADGEVLAVDERAFEPLRPTCCSLAVRAEAGTSGARSGEGLGDHDVEVDAVGAEPAAGMLARCEASVAEEVGQQGSVREVGWRHGEVGVRGVLGDGEVGVAGVEVDGLGAHQHERVAVRFECLGGVKERSAGSDVERVSHATHPRSCPSRRGAHFPPMVRGPVR